MKSYLAYIRVSTAKQGQFGSSLQEQRDAILGFAGRNGLHIAQWFEDRETAAKKGRTQFVRMMTLLEKGQAAGVILHKIDRGARNLWDWARLQDLIDMGREVRFAHDNLDLQSRGGRLAADIQAVVAADYVRNLREEVRKGVHGRYKQGLFPRKAPVGYLDQGKAKPKIIDPIKGRVIKVAFELYATKRYSYEALAKELMRLGLVRSSGRPYGPNNMTAILANPFYMGLIHIKRTGETFQGVHEPLVSADLFNRVQKIRDEKNHRKVQRNSFAFSRLVHCGLCRLALIGERQKGIVYYRCHTAACATTGVREDVVVSRLRALAAAIRLPEEEVDELLPYLSNEQETAERDRQASLQAARLRLASLEDRQKRLTDAFIDQAIDRDTYEARKATLLMDLAMAREAQQTAASLTPHVMTAVVNEYLELQNALWLGPVDEDHEQYRDAVEKLTSNRTLTAKSLEISPRSPFRELTSDPTILLGAPHRDRPRKTRASRARRTKHVGKLLKQWADEVGLVTKPPPLKRNSGWFKPKRPPQAFL